MKRKRTFFEKSKGVDGEKESKKVKLPEPTQNVFDQKKQVKIISWNVNSIKAMLSKEEGNYLYDMIEKERPTVVCIQETKLQQKNVSEYERILEDYDSVFFCSSGKKGYSGTAIYTLRNGPKVLSVKKGMGKKEHDEEGRTITVEYDDFYVVNTYVPNAGQKLDRLDYRTKNWDKDCLGYLQKLEEKKPFIWCGDLNVAHQEIDIHNPKGNKKSAGFTKEERESFDTLLKGGYVDTFRHLYPDKKNVYTYWGYRFKMREKDKGWRIDYFIVPEKNIENISDSYILKDVLGSDHCPIGLIYKLSNNGENDEEKEQDGKDKYNKETENVIKE